MLFNRYHEKSNLVKMLSLLNADGNEKKKIVAALPEKMLDRYASEEIKRELLLSESVESTNLIQTEVLAAVIAGADQMKCMRQAVRVINMGSDAMTVPKGNTTAYAPLKAEGAAADIQHQDYGSVSLNAHTYAMTAPISYELVEDAKFDIIETELNKLGKALENRINRIMIDTMVANAGLEHDTTGSNQGILAMVSAVAKVMDAGFIPDTVVMHPEMWAKVFADYKPAYNESAEATLRSGQMPTLLGLKPFVCGITATTATNWDYDTDGDLGCIVFAKDEAAVLGMRKDITVEYFKDPVKMLQSPMAYIRVDGSYAQADAICRIEF